MIRNSEVLIKAFIFDNRHQKKKKDSEKEKMIGKNRKDDKYDAIFPIIDSFRLLA